MTNSKEVVVIALGNRFRGDDGVGPTVADRLRYQHFGCTIFEGSDDAMAIVNAWEGAALTVVIDAATSEAAPGTIHRLEVDAKPLSRDMTRCSSHGLGLAEAVELGKVLGRLPTRLVIYAVEAKTFDPGVALSAEVTMAAVEVVRYIEADIASFANA